jgi:hypothetical protein
MHTLYNDGREKYFFFSQSFPLRLKKRKEKADKKIE